MSPKTGAIVAVMIMRLVLAPLCIMFAWNAIAWEFNLPQFPFWVPFLILLARELMNMQVKSSRKD